MKKNIIILFALSLIFTACAPNDIMRRPVPTEQYMEAKESSLYEVGEVKNCRITADNVNVRSGAGNSFEKVGSLNKDQVVDVLQQIGDWYVIQLDNNRIGCVNTANATPVVKEGEDHLVPKAQQPLGNQTVPQRNQPVPEVQKNVPAPAPAQTQTAPKLSSQAQQMVDLVNQERTKNGLKPLTVDLEVAKVAEVKSQDLVDNNYFSHYSPTYGSPFDMLKSFGVDYLSAGENLAGNSTVEKAHTALMNSSGHRKNILSPDFTHIGIGVKPSDKYGLMFTQMFISKPK